MKIYKRLNDEAYESLQRGTIRIGTLHYYKNTEDKSRKDKKEGPPPILIPSPEENKRVLTATELNYYSESVGSIYKLNPKLKITLNKSSTLQFDCDVNVFVFCTSIGRKSDVNLDKKFGNHVVEISDIEAFSMLISNELKRLIFKEKQIAIKGNAYGIASAHRKVDYLDKPNLTPDDATGEFVFNPLHAFTKDTYFDDEAEYRFLWMPAHESTGTMCGLAHGIKYVDLKLPDVLSLMKTIR